jgi:hypothetical protein
VEQEVTKSESMNYLISTEKVSIMHRKPIVNRHVGLNLYIPATDDYKFANKAIVYSFYFSVWSHGAPGMIQNKAMGKYYSVGEPFNDAIRPISALADAIREAGYTDGPILLQSCDAGTPHRNGKILAQELANEINTTVIATAGYNVLTRFPSFNFVLCPPNRKAFHPNR